jgi:adenine-specific DNA-methyltransferase
VAQRLWKVYKNNIFMVLMNEKIKDKKIRFGQFLTSKEIADFMTNLSTKPKSAKVLEPSAGQGVFIQSLIDKGFENINGVELDEQFFNLLQDNFPKTNFQLVDFLKTSINEKYDLIIGNPPYVQWNHMELEIREKLSKDIFWSKYSNGEWDLLYAFIIWSIEKLNKNGELIFIVPYNWFNSTFGKSLRQYLVDNGYFDIILHFGELKLFGDCFPNNIIFKYIKSKSKTKPEMKVCEFPERKANIPEILKRINSFLFENKSKDNGLKCFKMQNFESPDNWFLGNKEDVEFLNKLEKACSNKNGDYTKVSDYFNVSVGMVSGFDEAFILTNSDKFSEKENKVIFDFVKAKNCTRFIVDGKTKYIFADEINSEEELKDLSNIYNRLYLYKERLAKRYLSKNREWWNWATVRNYEIFKLNLDKPKIFVPCIDRALKPRFSYTTEPVYGSGDVLMITKAGDVKEDLLYVLAWLNSESINKWYRLKGSRKGHRTQYTQAYVSKIPFRQIDWSNENEIGIYNKIIELSKKLINNENEQFEIELDNLISNLI